MEKNAKTSRHLTESPPNPLVPPRTPCPIPAHPALLQSCYNSSLKSIMIFSERKWNLFFEEQVMRNLALQIHDTRGSPGLLQRKWKVAKTTRSVCCASWSRATNAMCGRLKMLPRLSSFNWVSRSPKYSTWYHSFFQKPFVHSMELYRMTTDCFTISSAGREESSADHGKIIYFKSFIRFLMLLTISVLLLFRD